MKIILFETNQVKNLHPITLTRPAFDIMCGGTTLFDLVRKEFKESKIDFLVRDYLAETAKIKFKISSSTDNQVLFLNAQLVPSFESLGKLVERIVAKPNRVFVSKNQLIGFYLPDYKTGISPKNYDDLLKLIKKLGLPKQEIQCQIIEYPWQVVTFNEEILSSNLKYLTKGMTEKSAGVFVGKNVIIPQQTVLDASHGPIFIGEGTQILPFCHLVGPLYIGKNCVVREFTILKYSCCFGDGCKVAGEIEATVMQSYGNKNHYGFLGYSYLGQWVNLGAGTTTSNLKNNYSPVKMAGINTGHQFLGSVVGDYCRTAINCTIYTGKLIGVNSHLYGTVTTDVPSFTNYAKDFGCVVEFSLDKAIELQKIVMARREKKQQKPDAELLKKVFALTSGDRRVGKVKKGKICFR